MLDVTGLTVSYGKHRALEDAALSVSQGEIVVILGANGAGKSTLLKAVTGICEGKVSGEATLDGVSLAGMKPEQIVEEGVALVPEGRGIFGDLSVEENLRLGAFPNRAQGDEAANLERVFGLFPKLVERRRQIARTMSGGEQQMVAIGRAMMSSPKVLLLDEPSLGLSPLLCKELFGNLKAVKALGIGVLMVEQNAKQSLAIADRGYLLENTRIVHEDRAEALMHDPAVQAAYLGGGGGKAASAASGMAPRPAQEAPQADLPSHVVPRHAPRRVSADTLAGTDLDALVARAGGTAQEASPATAAPMPQGGEGAGERAEGIAALLQEFEMAAAKAGRSKPLADYAPRAKPAAPAPEAPPERPVTIEVYRAPRVEVYRKRPGSDQFDRN